GSLADAEESMAELAELATSAGVVVQDRIIQRRQAIDPRTVLGRGKLDELIIRALQLGADMLVFDSELSPAQVRSLSEATDLKVIDRSQLILDIRSVASDNDLTCAGDSSLSKTSMSAPSWSARMMSSSSLPRPSTVRGSIACRR